jgi:citrate lyase subunit beta / citryl-CoA lyase
MHATAPRAQPRCILYAPAHSTALFESARAARPDTLIIDLEDGVPPEHKPLARLGLEGLARGTRTAGLGLVVRVNGVDTPWFADDVAAAIAVAPDAVLLPKAGREELTELAATIESLDASVPIWGLVENTRDLLTVGMGGPPLQAVTIGYGDLCKELGLTLGSEHAEFAGARTLVLAAASEHGFWPIDGVVVAPPDDAERLCRQSADAGFTGRTLYDPRQVAGCRAAFERNGSSVTVQS